MTLGHGTFTVRESIDEDIRINTNVCTFLYSEILSCMVKESVKLKTIYILAYSEFFSNAYEKW